MFSNGSEYSAFSASNCDKCEHMVYVDEIEAGKPPCQIEERIALAGMVEESPFPYEWLNENGAMSRYDCRKRLGLEVLPLNQEEKKVPPKSTNSGVLDILSIEK